MSLLLRMTKSYFTTGRYVIIDSGFCVLKGLIKLRKKGIFSCAVIKKRRYWPSMVPGYLGSFWGGGSGGYRCRTGNSC